MFKNVQRNVKDAEPSGWPQTSTNDEKQEEDRAIILADRRLRTEEMASQLGVSEGMVYSLVHDILGLREVSAR
jgi:hypothetical protein